MSTAAHRQLVNVQLAEGEQVKLPDVLTTNIRQDVVHFTHTQLAKNDRQAHSTWFNAGAHTSAISWGTGRAMARIPRVKGGGSHRSGQGAFGNMCRGGRMYQPLKVYRKIHRRVSSGTKRYAVSAALAATAVPSLLLARGHRTSQVPEVPLVVADNAFDGITKTKDAIALLQKIGAYEDVEKVKASRTMRAGQGKARGRRYVQRRGPLVVYDAESSFRTAARALPGVEFAQVDRLNLLQLAPGAHLGRFIVWTKSAFAKLDTIFGTRDAPSKVKKNFVLPRPIVANADITRVMTSASVRAALKKAGPAKQIKAARKRNPLKNLNALIKLNPAAGGQRRRAIALSQGKAKRNATVSTKRKQRASKAFVDTLIAP